jgi:hypothetical protein
MEVTSMANDSRSTSHVRSREAGTISINSLREILLLQVSRQRWRPVSAMIPAVAPMVFS